MSEKLSAKKYAEISNTSANDVIAKIKSGELKGHSKAFVWYVDDVDVEALREKKERTEKSADSWSASTGFSNSQEKRTDVTHSKQKDSIAEILNIIAWLILVAGLILVLYLLNASPSNNAIPAITTIGASLFSAIMLIGFSRIIQYLKMISERLIEE